MYPNNTRTVGVHEYMYWYLVTAPVMVSHRGIALADNNLLRRDQGSQHSPVTSRISNLSSRGGGGMELPGLVFIGDRELLSPCEPCDVAKISSPPNENLQEQLRMLKACQKAYGGIGIAACQVGWRTRIFCMGIDVDDEAARARYPDAKPFPHQFWVNPSITPHMEQGTSWFWEGCLSVPGMRGWVERPNAVHMQGWNENGEPIEAELDGLPARVAQHEYDHLDGVLFPDRALAGTLLPVRAFEDDRQDKWPENWPTPGARKTKPGGFSEVK
ncbi:Peptide deformylase [Seminavis robusta]|uniref:Peptide deformylase n=1 Tax=Seminavis robusta TaxID=568900 RepID=A0A9N8HDN5_9STRA|nr:Peptide deformylase [Seminavis robusta]|eukprot:Sro470_g149410.1 Peptide deformylase (272) ;mRNA; f:4801-5743